VRAVAITREKDQMKKLACRRVSGAVGGKRAPSAGSIKARVRKN